MPGRQSIEEKCELLETYLLPLKPALNDSNMIKFSAIISQHDRNYFNNHSTLIDYFQNRLFSICDSARCYKFRISFGHDENENDIANVILSLLQIPTIERCSNVEMEIQWLWGVNKQLSVEVISNLLEKSVDGMEINDQYKNEKFLASKELSVLRSGNGVKITKLKSKGQKKKLILGRNVKSFDRSWTVVL